MLKITTDEDKKTASVSGPPHELVMFYCVWQSYLWPNWATEMDLSKDDVFSQQTKIMMDRINNNSGLLLSWSDSLFKDALVKTKNQLSIIEIIELRKIKD